MPRVSQELAIAKVIPDDRLPVSGIVKIKGVSYPIHPLDLAECPTWGDPEFSAKMEKVIPVALQIERCPSFVIDNLDGQVWDVGHNFHLDYCTPEERCAHLVKVFNHFGYEASLDANGKVVLSQESLRLLNSKANPELSAALMSLPPL